MRRLLFVLPLVVVALIVWATGLHTGYDAEAIGQLLERAGIWGPVLFIVLFGLEGFGVPGAVFMAVAIVIWPPLVALLYNTLGALCAALVGFGYARWMGRDWVAERLPARVRRYEARIEERGLVAVILVRLVFFIAPPAHWVLGVSSVRFRDYVLGTALGNLPWLVAVSYGGGHAMRWLAEQPKETWMAVGGAIALAASWRVVARRVSRTTDGTSPERVR